RAADRGHRAQPADRTRPRPLFRRTRRTRHRPGLRDRPGRADILTLTSFTVGRDRSLAERELPGLRGVPNAVPSPRSHARGHARTHDRSAGPTEMNSHPPAAASWASCAASPLIENPPSTVTSDPVANAASSETRYVAA